MTESRERWRSLRRPAVEGHTDGHGVLDRRTQTVGVAPVLWEVLPKATRSLLCVGPGESLDRVGGNGGAPSEGDG